MEVYCPFRVCPLGAHIDHQYGVVSGFAIDKGITIEYEETMSMIIIQSQIYEEIISFNYSCPIIKENNYGDYFKGVVEFLKREYTLTKGIKALIKADLPSGGIASSTSSILVFLKAITIVNDIELTEMLAFKVVAYVEREYIGVKIGILDQSSIIYSKASSLMFLDTLTNYYQIVENKQFDDKYVFLVIYSGVRRSLVNSSYNQRTAECLEAYNNLSSNLHLSSSLKKLREIPYYRYEEFKNNLGTVEEKRCHHYFTENKRVHEGLKAWRNNDMVIFGKLMNESCESSIKYYESGSKNLIDLYDIMKGIDGVLGGRFLGAGFNGSSVCLIKKQEKIKIIKEITKQYLNLYPQLINDFQIMEVKMSDGIEL